MIFVQSISAQQDKHKLSLGINFGRTFPIGKFADFQNGLGNGGRYLHFQIGYLINNDFTIQNTLQFSFVDNRTINDRLGYLFPDYPIFYNAPFTALSFYPTLNKKIFFDKAKKKHWLSIFAGAGIEMNQTFYDRTNISNQNSTPTAYINGDQHFSAVFVVGGSYERSVYKGLFFKVLLDYQVSNFGTEDIVISYIDLTQNSFRLDDQYFGWLGRINFGIGLGVRFLN